MSDSALLAGETSTLTITFSEAVTGFDNSDITLENGTLSAISSSDGGVTWTGTFTPDTNVDDTTNVISVGTTLTDLAGNAPLAGASSANYTIATVIPSIDSITMSDTVLKTGETSLLTITFSEVVTGFDNSDLTVENGTLTAVSSSDGGVTWTATFTPDDNVDDNTNVITIGTDWTDLDTNSPLAGGTSPNYAINTSEPLASVTLSDYDLTAGETAIVTFTFSEVITNFDNTDVTVENGTLTNVSSSDGGVTWTAVFTPTAGTEDTTNVITPRHSLGRPGGQSATCQHVVGQLLHRYEIAIGGQHRHVRYRPDCG